MPASLSSRMQHLISSNNPAHLPASPDHSLMSLAVHSRVPQRFFPLYFRSFYVCCCYQSVHRERSLRRANRFCQYALACHAGDRDALLRRVPCTCSWRTVFQWSPPEISITTHCMNSIYRPRVGSRSCLVNPVRGESGLAWDDALYCLYRRQECGTLCVG